MLEIDRKIKDIDKTICDNIALIDFAGVTRALISQNLLGQSRNLVEHIAVKISGQGADIDVNWDTIQAAKDFIKQNNKYLFLRQFHTFLQESKSHYTPDSEGAERLALKYYRYYLQLRNFMQKEYQMEILRNLEKFPVDTDKSVQEYHEKIAERIEVHRQIRDLSHAQRMYVHKVVPFIVNEAVYYEIILTPVYDTTSKFDRFVCYSSILVPSYYSIKADIYYEDIQVQDKRMPVNIMEPHDSKPYNPDIANVFYRAGFIENWGQGIQKICDECQGIGAELPVYELIGTTLRIRFKALESALIDQPKVPKDHADTLADTLADRIIALLKVEPSMTQGTLAEKTKVSVPSIKRTMKILSDKGRIVRKGGKRYGYWEVND